MAISVLLGFSPAFQSISTQFIPSPIPSTAPFLPVHACVQEGYKDSVAQAREDALQRGFGDGFARGFALGRAQGKILGVSTWGLHPLPNFPKSPWHITNTIRKNKKRTPLHAHSSSLKTQHAKHSKQHAAGCSRGLLTLALPQHRAGGGARRFNLRSCGFREEGVRRPCDCRG